MTSAAKQKYPTLAVTMATCHIVIKPLPSMSCFIHCVEALRTFRNLCFVVDYKIMVNYKQTKTRDVVCVDIGLELISFAWRSKFLSCLLDSDNNY